MYLDHHAVQRIAHILEQIDNPALLMDDGGNVLYPEGDQRHLTLPEAVRNDPSRPLIYGGVTLIGTTPKEAACIMAIVSDESGIPLNQLRFISIKAI